jgi:hypothetical protein
MNGSVLGSLPTIARTVSWSRREFLRSVGAAGLGSALLGFAPLRAMARARGQKAVVVTFGGGARDEETFAPEGQENIPRLIHELIPQGTFFTQVVNRGILGHYVATASLATGVYETINNFASLPPQNPTVFEYYRKALKRPANDAWVVAPSNGFNRIGESDHRSYGAGLGAGVILPKHLLSAALTGSNANYNHLLHDNYETPLYTLEIGNNEFHTQQLEQILRLSVSDFTAHARSLSSPDELSVYIARQLMHELAPSLLWITLHDIDVAHSGAYSPTSKAFVGQTVSAQTSGRQLRMNLNMPAKPRCLSSQILAVTPMEIPVVTGSSTTALAIHFHAPRG